MFKRISNIGLPLFFFVPILGFFASLFDIRSKKSAVVYVLFAMVVGLSFSFSDPSADSFRYAEAFRSFDNTLSYNRIVEMYRNGELRDLYRILLFFSVSIFSNNPKILFAVAGLIYGFLSYLCMRTFVNSSGGKWDRYILIMALVFFTYISLASLNGFRFNTGALLFYYATYQLIIKRKNFWFIGILATLFFHYGFLLIIPVIALYKLVQRFFFDENRVNFVLYAVFFITFSMSWVLGPNSIKLGFIVESDVLTGAAAERMKYINSEKVGSLVVDRAENSSFLSVQKYFTGAIKIYVFILIFFIKKIMKNAIGNKTEFLRLNAFVVFFYSFCFIAASIPSGSRFLYVAHLFFILLLVRFYQVYNEKKYKKLLLLALPVFSFNIVFINLMLPYLVLSPTFWYGNFFMIIGESINFQY